MTRQRIFAAAATVFAERGVAGATIGQIAAEAGFTRGAFYSNFRTTDEVALAMLDDHLARSHDHNRSLLAANPDAKSLVRALRRDEGREDDPLHQNPLLQVELMMHVARTPELRSRMGEQLQAMRGLLGEIAAKALADKRPDVDVDPHRLGTILVAIEDGLRLHRIIDPASTPAGAFLDALDLLEQLVGGD